MVLYLIGLGLGNAEDITVKGLKAIQRSQKVYLEAYTSVLAASKDELEQAYDVKHIELLYRQDVEDDVLTDRVLDEAVDQDVCFLVVGDPFGATTHTDFALRAKRRGVRCHVIHNASILNAVGCCGLQLYSFGRTVSIPFWTESWKPKSFFKEIEANLSRGCHTLCLLDIKVREQSEVNLARGRMNIFESPRFMSVAVAASQLLECLKDSENSAVDLADHVVEEKVQRISPGYVCIGLARIGQESQKLVFGPMQDLTTFDLGPPLHSLIIPGTLHPMEKEFLEAFATEIRP